MICLDTMVLIWGLQEKSRDSQTDMIRRTKRYMDSLPAKEIVMVPAIVLAEYLTGFPDQQKRLEQYAIMNRRFFVAGFDAQCAEVVAELAQQTETQILIAENGRRVVKADLQIIATAIVHGAQKIVTNNTKEYERLAAGRIKVSPVPDVAVQVALYEQQTAN